MTEPLATAYVNFIATTEGLEDDLEAAAKRAGEKTGEVYAKEFEKAIRKAARRDSDRLFAQQEAAADASGGRAGTRFRRSFNSRVTAGGGVTLISNRQVQRFANTLQQSVAQAVTAGMRQGLSRGGRGGGGRGGRGGSGFGGRGFRIPGLRGFTEGFGELLTFQPPNSAGGLLAVAAAATAALPTVGALFNELLAIGGVLAGLPALILGVAGAFVVLRGTGEAFAREAEGLTGPLSDVVEDARALVTSGLAPYFTRLRNQLPGLSRGLNGLATGFNNLIRASLRGLESQGAGNTLGRIGESFGGALGNLGPGVTAGLGLFLQIADQVSARLPRLSAEFSRFLVTVERRAQDTDFGAIFETGLRNLNDLIFGLINGVQAAQSFFRALNGDRPSTVLADLRAFFQGIEDTLARPEVRQRIAEIGNALRIVGDTVQAVGRVFVTFVTSALSPLIDRLNAPAIRTQVARISQAFRDDFLPAIRDLGRAVGDLATELLDFVLDNGPAIVSGLAPVVSTFAGFLDTVTNLIRAIRGLDDAIPVSNKLQNFISPPNRSDASAVRARDNFRAGERDLGRSGGDAAIAAGNARLVPVDEILGRDKLEDPIAARLEQAGRFLRDKILQFGRFLGEGFAQTFRDIGAFIGAPFVFLGKLTVDGVIAIDNFGNRLIERLRVKGTEIGLAFARIGAEVQRNGGGLPGLIRTIVQRIVSAFDSSGAIGSGLIAGIQTLYARLLGQIARFQSLPGVPNIVDTRGLGPRATGRNPGRRRTGRVEEFAEGGLVTAPTHALIGEAGPELILPLTRPRRMAELMEQAGLTTQATTRTREVSVSAPVSIYTQTVDDKAVRRLERRLLAAVR